MTGRAGRRQPGRSTKPSHRPVDGVHPLTGAVAVVGRGRVGSALVRNLRAAGVEVSGPHARGFAGGRAGVVVLAVPDDRIAEAAALIGPDRVIGHCSGASGLDVLNTPDGFSLHPLTTVADGSASFEGVPAALAATSERALAAGTELAEVLGMQPFSVAEDNRAGYHAGAAMAANFLMTVQWAAQRLLTSAAVDPRVVEPLARQALDNYFRLGPAALTGPVARGDAGTVAAHRQVVGERAPDLLPLFDALVAATQQVATESRPTSVEVAG